MTQKIFILTYNQQKEVARNYSLSIYVVSFLLVFVSFSIYAKDVKEESRPAASIWYQELAEEGDVDAKYNLGMMNEVGWSIPVNLKKAIRWYREAAKEGHAEAQLRLGMLYYLGLGTKSSNLKGESWIRKSSKQGHKFSRALNKSLFEEGVPDSLDQKNVMGKVRKVYLQDETKAISKLGKLIKAAQQKSKATQLAKDATTIRQRRGVDASQVTSDEMEKELERIESVVPEFIRKKSIKENRTLALGNLTTIRHQANKGLASAQYNLGRMYDLGIKVPVDKVKALAWYKKSADQGYADAQYRWAISKLYGLNTGKDVRVGKKWLSLAAGNGHQTAKNLLAKLTNQEGEFGSGNSIVVNWYLEKAITGNADAALNLGKLFEHGRGVNPDLREAIKWYQHAQMLGAKGAEELLRDAKLHLAQIENNPGEMGSTTDSFRPPDWIVYLLAVLLAIGIVFWPLIKRRKAKRAQATNDNITNKALPKKESPFG